METRPEFSFTDSDPFSPAKLVWSPVETEKDNEDTILTADLPRDLQLPQLNLPPLNLPQLNLPPAPLEPICLKEAVTKVDGLEYRVSLLLSPDGSKHIQVQDCEGRVIKVFTQPNTTIWKDFFIYRGFVFITRPLLYVDSSPDVFYLRDVIENPNCPLPFFAADTIGSPLASSPLASSPLASSVVDFTTEPETIIIPFFSFQNPFGWILGRFGNLNLLKTKAGDSVIWSLESAESAEDQEPENLFDKRMTTDFGEASFLLLDGRGRVWVLTNQEEQSILVYDSDFTLLFQGTTGTFIEHMEAVEGEVFACCGELQRFLFSLEPR